MKEITAIARREIVARRDLLLLAAAVMMISVLMPLVPGTSNYDPASTRSVASQVLALLLGCGIAAGLGISTFGRDLASGRLGFFQ